MSGEWTECKLGDVLTLKRGYDLPTRKRQPGDVPIVSSSGITGFHNEAKVNGPGIVTGRYGTLGEVFYVDDDYWPLNTTLYVQDFKGNDPRFVGYFLRTLSFAAQNAAGAVPGVNRNHLHMMPVSVPPLHEQQRIASILSAYDDLIENNRRRIEILEEMARNIYREWFVHFRFPGHEDVQFIDSPLGPIPEGWEVRRLGDVASLHRKSISPAKQLEQAFAHYSLPAFDESQLPVIESGESIRSNKYLMPEQCVLLSKLNPRIPRVWLVLNGPPEPAIASTEFMVLTPEEPVSIEFLFSHCRSDEFMGTLAGVAGGTSTSHQRVKPDTVLSSELVVADSVVMSTFTEIASPLLKLSLQLRQRNRVLSQTRDLLLPRLLTGDYGGQLQTSMLME